MWPARAAIRPVSAHAQVGEHAVWHAEEGLGAPEGLEERLEDAFVTLETSQPALGAWLREELDGVRDETSRALGFVLATVVHRAFAESFGARLRRVGDDALASVRAAFAWDEELRRGFADEMLESDDLVAIAQPHLVAFVRGEHEAALVLDEDGEAPDVDLDAAASVYRAVLIEILALGEAVATGLGPQPSPLLA